MSRRMPRVSEGSVLYPSLIHTVKMITTAPCTLIMKILGTMAAKDALKIQMKYNPDLEQLKRNVEPFRNIKLEVIRDE